MSKWNYKPVKDLFRIKSGDFLSSRSFVETGEYSVYGGNGVTGLYNNYNLEGKNIIIGRVGANCGNVRAIEGRIWVTDNAFYITEFLEEFDKDFLSAMLNALKLGETANKAAQPVVSYKGIKNLKIPLPPIEEQQRIVAKLDALFERIDKAIALTQATLQQHLPQLMASVLDEEFGKLEGERKKLKEISEKIQYGYTGKVKSKGEYFYLRITDIQDNRVDYTNVPYSDIPQSQVGKYKLQKGDVLFARTGATAGKSYLFKDDVDSVFASYLIRVQCDKSIIKPEFIKWYFRSGEYWQQIFGNIVGAAQPNFNGSKLGDLIIPIPDTKDQAKAANVFEKLDDIVVSITTYETQKLESLQALKASLLDQAFKGEL